MRSYSSAAVLRYWLEVPPQTNSRTRFLVIIGSPIFTQQPQLIADSHMACHIVRYSPTFDQELIHSNDMWTRGQSVQVIRRSRRTRHGKHNIVVTTTAA